MRSRRKGWAIGLCGWIDWSIGVLRTVLATARIAVKALIVRL